MGHFTHMYRTTDICEEYKRKLTESNGVWTADIYTNYV